MGPFEKLKKFFSAYTAITYRRHETILRAGEEPQGVLFLNKGYVRAYSVSEAGQEITLIIFKPGDFFPVMWAINKIQNKYYLETLTRVELNRAGRDLFINFLKENPDVLFEITSKLLVRLGGVLERMEYLAYGNAYQKIASILAICAERFGERNGKEITIKVPLTHKDIALLLGITRETTSIEVKKLQEKGIVNYKGKFIKVKIKRLLEESLLNV